jgi:hypothetical protein
MKRYICFYWCMGIIHLKKLMVFVGNQNVLILNIKNKIVIFNSNAIGYVTSNFLGQLHLQVKINFTFYHGLNLRQNIDLK